MLKFHANNGTTEHVRHATPVDQYADCKTKVKPGFFSFFDFVIKFYNSNQIFGKSFLVTLMVVCNLLSNVYIFSVSVVSRISLHCIFSKSLQLESVFGRSLVVSKYDQLEVA